MAMIDNTWRIVLWGFRPDYGHYHTHSHIHWAWRRAFDYLGYKTYWLTDRDNLEGVGIDFSHTLFITAGGCDEDLKIPLLQDSFYVVHHPTSDKYQKYPHLRTSTYTNAISDKCEKLEDCQYFDGEVWYLIWATDLMPNQIDEMKPAAIDLSSREDYFIGTVGSSTSMFGNSDELLGYKMACDKAGVDFRFRGGFSGDAVSREENIRLIQRSLTAPTIVGKWQREVSYVPCRVFKNLSYGKFTPTNSPQVNALFGDRLICNPDTSVLFEETMSRLRRISVSELHELMDFVRDHHTYLNRVATLIECASRSEEHTSELQSHSFISYA